MENLAKFKFDLILKNTDALSGTPKILMRHADVLLKYGAQVSVISENFHPSLKNNPLIECKKTLKWPKSTLFQRKVFNWEASRKVRSDSIVIGHGDTLHQDILFLHTCAEKGSEVAPGPHNLKNFSIPFHRMIFEQGSFKEVVCVSHFMKDDIQKRYNVQVPMRVLHPGFDKNIIHKVNPTIVNEIKSELKVLPDDIVVAVIASGNLDNRGAFALIKSFAFIEESLKEKVKIFIVGKESKPARIYKAAEEVGMGERILWKNASPEVASFIATADIVVHAANIEASGLTFLEFMALSRPVIATKTVGFSEILPEAQKDFVIEKQDPEQIAQKLKILLSSKDLRLTLGNANTLVAQGMTWEKYDEGFEKIIQEHIEKYRR